MSSDGTRSKKGRAGSWLVNLLLVAAVALCALIVVPAVLGYHRYVIDGHSMDPAIPYGSVAYEKDVPVSQLEVGDVITFKPPEAYAFKQPVTHRIIEIKTTETGERAFRTKGDNNADADPWTVTLDQPEQPRVAFHLPYVGYIYIALSIWWVRILLIALPALAVAVWIGVLLWKEAGRDVEREKERLAAERAIVP